MRFNFCLLGLFLVTCIAFFSWVSLGEFVCVCVLQTVVCSYEAVYVLCGMICVPRDPGLMW